LGIVTLECIQDWTVRKYTIDLSQQLATNIKYLQVQTLKNVSVKGQKGLILNSNIDTDMYLLYELEIII
jgi:hypothetical protein